MGSRIRICKEADCKNAQTTEGYCRLHYLRNWKKIKEEAKKRSAKRLNRYIEHVVKTHPGRYLEIIKKEIRSPNFDNYIEEKFGYDEEKEANVIFDEPTYEEEIEKLIRELKVEKGF